MNNSKISINKEYKTEMDNLEDSMFHNIKKQLEFIDIVFTRKYIKSRSEYKKSRIRGMMEKKRYYENFVNNLEKGNLNRRMIDLLFGYDYRYIQNRKMYIALEHFLINIRKDFHR